MIKIKACTFTIMHFLIAFSVAFALTGSFVVGGAIALIEPLCNAVGYVFHEKAWDKFSAKRASREAELTVPTSG